MPPFPIVVVHKQERNDDEKEKHADSGGCLGKCSDWM